ncbi:MAG: reprolysin-like metallopeptidase [Planctomycetota bacterium]
MLSSPYSRAQSTDPTSPDGVWTIVKDAVFPEETPLPSSFAVAVLDNATLARILGAAPRENPSTPNAGVPLFLPLPDGSFVEVFVAAADLMERQIALMDGFDEIATFRYDSAGEPAFGGFLVTAPESFIGTGNLAGDLLTIEAAETTAGAIVYIVALGNAQPPERGVFNHIANESGAPDPTPPLEREYPGLDPDYEPPIPPVPIVEDGTDPVLDLGLPTVQALATEVSDGTLRRYRIAVVTSGEFYQANSDPNNALNDDAEVVLSILQRLALANAVFEPEVGVRLVLSTATLSVLFDDPNTDPFADGATAGEMRDLQPLIFTLFAIFGGVDPDSYDLAFALGARSGSGNNGSAWYVVCKDANLEKTRGAGLVGNNGTNLAPGLLLHEIGHQLGARHTYSGQQCDLPNFDGDDEDALGDGDGDLASAYEPGSGTTIMSYFGSCGTDDVDSDPLGTGRYFNIKSIEQMRAEVTTGDGSTCGALLDFGNMAPDIDAGPDHSIPRDTPFTLTPDSVSDPNGDVVEVAWEQVDLTTVRVAIDTDNGTNPIIRSAPPTEDHYRTIPDIRDVLTDTDRKGTYLPDMDRTMTFRASARDGQMGGGGVSTDDVVLTVSGDPFRVTKPFSALTLAGCTAPVEWTVGGSAQHSANVDILYSLTGGLEDVDEPVRESFPITIVTGTPNDGEYMMSVPCTETERGRVKVQASSSIFFDVNPNDFEVVEQAPDVIWPAIPDGTVDDQCEATVEFTATVQDDCGILANDVSVSVQPLSANFTLGTPVVGIQQLFPNQVGVTGSVLVSDLTGGPASLRVTVDGTDNCSLMTSESRDVTITDDTPPVISVAVEPDSLWPADHMMETVTATVEATDNCSDVTVVLQEVTSDEPDNGKGIGDGNTVSDIQDAAVGSEDLSFALRRERDQNQDGRTYTITYKATDGSNNMATDTATVTVPHDQN